ncbi:MAG: GHKL domain-containing protein [Oscillospiraceae bacterium]|jgi:hypothetical protein|nr:GHKL domain-containing protein [Oscillospiraceae bacterium]
MDKLLIDLLGTGVEILAIMLFYGTFWEMKKRNWPILIGGLVCATIVNVVVTAYFQGAIILPAVAVVINCCLSFYFVSNVTSKFLLVLVITVIMLTTEILVGILLVQVLEIQIAEMQSNFSTYILGVLVSKFVSLLLVYLIRFFINKGKEQVDRQFNLLMMFMPVQSIILCFIINEFTSNIDNPRISTLGLLAVIISLCLVFITIIILDRQRRALSYKKEYELAQLRLEIQIEHYQKLYQTQREVRSIRHDMNNALIAISGMLAEGQIGDALRHIKRIQTDIKRTADVVDTGFPAIDAILQAKINRASESDIHVVHTVLLVGSLAVDQFDLAVVVASALDNAIEGILRSADVKREILLRITNTSGNVSVLVENFVSGPVDVSFRTSKPDKGNHGFGLAQIKAIAHKYDGDVTPHWDPKDGKFSLKVLLQNRSV